MRPSARTHAALGLDYITPRLHYSIPALPQEPQRVITSAADKISSGDLWFESR